MKSKLNGWDLVQGINTWAVSILKYSAAFIRWRKCEVQTIDRKTRKLFTIYGGLHPKSDADRLHILRMIAIEDCLELAVRGFEVYVHGSEARLIQAARRDRVDGLEAASVLKKTKKEKGFQDWEDQALHGQYLRQTKEVRSE